MGSHTTSRASRGHRLRNTDLVECLFKPFSRSGKLYYVGEVPEVGVACGVTRACGPVLCGLRLTVWLPLSKNHLPVSQTLYTQKYIGVVLVVVCPSF